MKRCFLAVLFFASSLQLYAEIFRIGLFRSEQFSSVEFIVAESSYTLLLSNGKPVSLNTGDYISVTPSGQALKVKKNGKQVGSYNKVRLVTTLADGSMRIKLAPKEDAIFTYGGHFEITAFKEKLKIINFIDQESYVASAVESEIGNNAQPEFLKVQSVLCRTYALNHLTRHAVEGFELCDQVHCQAYKGKSRFNIRIKSAIDSTRNLVLVDTKNKLIVAAYHSNCGGRTTTADQVWSKPIEYLQAVNDTFCLEGNHASWIATISVKDWKGYLASKGIVTTANDSLFTDTLFNFKNENRVNAIMYNNQWLPVKDIRNDWKLKSTWFTMTVANDSIEFGGRGFGHGVGLCQEGAMKMAEYGFEFHDIINFYFKDVRLADVDAIKLYEMK